MKSLSHFLSQRRPMREQGFSLVELMVASAIGLIIVAGVSYVFLESSQSRNEIAKSSRQIENGRYAADELKKGIQLAGFYGEYTPILSGGAAVQWTTPDPCSITLKDMGFAFKDYSWNTAAGKTLVPVALQGYTEAETAPSCIPNRKAGTDILVVRRTSTTAIQIDADGDGAPDANVDTNGDGTTDATYASLGAAYHLQVSNCSDIPAEHGFVMDNDTSKFTLHTVKPAGTPASCLNGGRSTVRRYIVHIYYISTCNDCTGSGDGIPTLKVVELTPAASPCAPNPAASCGSMSTPRAIADGIENLQLEYGIDSDDNGTPNTFNSTVAAGDWEKVVAVKIFLLARNTEPTTGYTDVKKYSLNSAGTELTAADGTALTPFNDSYKRHVYSSTVMATNVAGRKLQ